MLYGADTISSLYCLQVGRSAIPADVRAMSVEVVKKTTLSDVVVITTKRTEPHLIRPFATFTLSPTTLDLTEVGSAIYAADPTTDVNCVSFCIVTGDVRGPTLTWLPGEPIPPEILEAAADPETLFVAHNDAFERAITTHILHPRYGWPLIPIERRRCTMASALSHVLPAILDKVTAALQLPQRKLAKGKTEMLKFAKPRKPRKGRRSERHLLARQVRSRF